MIEVIEVALLAGLFEQRWDCIYLMRLFEHHSVPRLEPGQYIAIVEFISQQINESLGFVLLDPLLPTHRILIHYYPIQLILLQLLQIPKILNPTLILLPILPILTALDAVIHLDFFGGVLVVFILREEESDGLILLGAGDVVVEFWVVDGYLARVVDV